MTTESSHSKREPLILDGEEERIAEALVAARKVQQFLWAETRPGERYGLEGFRRVLRKRLAKLEEVDVSQPHWRIETRKRLLQIAAVACHFMRRLDDPDFKADLATDLSSNSMRYTEPVTDRGSNA